VKIIVDHFRVLAFAQENPKDLLLKDLFQALRLQFRGYLERSASMESAVGAEHVAMRLEVQKIAKSLVSNDGPWVYPFPGKGGLEEPLKGISHATTQF